MSSITSEALFGADTRKSAGARAWGEMLLGNAAGLGIGKGAMPKSAMAGHVSAAQRNVVNDFHRIGGSPFVHGAAVAGYYRKGAELLEEARRVERMAPGPQREALAKAVEAAADGLSRAGGNRNFRSQSVDSREFREPRGNASEFQTSGRVTSPGGPDARAGYSYPADRPTRPMEALFGPAVNADQMNWPGVDDDAPGGERAGATTYDPSRPVKSLPPLGIRKSLDTALSLVVDGKLEEGAYRDLVRWRTNLAQATPSARAAFKRDPELQALIRRIEASTRISAVEKAALTESLAYA